MSQEQSKDMSQYFYRASAADFMKIPGSPVAYWLSPKLLDIFSAEQPLSELATVRQGLATSDNTQFVRYWSEVGLNRIGFGVLDRDTALTSQKKWFPFNKGGSFRRWAGNSELVVNWENDGAAIKHSIITKYPYLNGNPDFVAKNPNFYFKKGLTWSALSSGLFSLRYQPEGFIFADKGQAMFPYSEENLIPIQGLLNSKVCIQFLKAISPTLDFNGGYIAKLPCIMADAQHVKRLNEISELDWNSYETSWEFSQNALASISSSNAKLSDYYKELGNHLEKSSRETHRLEEENNRLFIEAYGLEDELTPDVPLEEITLTCNPHYRYGRNRTEEERETLQQCDTIKELASYAIGCMMGRYSLDKAGLILASQGETLQDYLRQIPAPRFAPDDDGILPLTDQEWFADDATNRFREFVRIVWGDEHLKQNLDFVAESLCLHAIKPPSTRSGGESALDTIRRYLSTQFFKDHLRTYKKRPIYWLFSSGKHKAFECLVYLHRYHEGTLARMRTEYVIPLSAKLNSYAEKLEQDKDASTSAAEIKRISNELATLHKQQAELAQFDEKLRHFADQRISLDLDDGVKVNYGKFGDLLAEVKAVTGGE